MLEISKDLVIPVLSALLAALVAHSVSERAIQAEEKKGRVLLQTLAQRYFISFLNSFDLKTNEIKKDELSRSQHIAELESILEDFSPLATNTFYRRLIDKSPHLIKCVVSARRELVEHKYRKEFGPTFALSLGTAKDFAALYRESRKGKQGRLPIEDVIERVEKQ